MTGQAEGRAAALPPGLPTGRLFLALLHSSAEGVALSHAGGTLIEVNDAFARMTGYSREELIGRSAPELGLMDPGARSAIIAELQEAGRVETRLIELRRRDGSRRQVEISCDALPGGEEGPEGDDTFLVTVLNDLTARREAEAAAREAETRYRELFESAATGIVRVDAQGGFLEVNRAWARVLGYETPATYIAQIRNARNIYVDPADRAALLRIVGEHGSAQGFEAALKHRDGSTVWVALDAQAARNEAGEIVGLHASGLDITARKRAEETLRGSEARFRSIFVNSLEGILLTCDGVIISANPAACAMLGRTESELCTLGLAAVTGLGEERLTAAFAHPSARGRAGIELRLIRADGSTFPAEISASVFADADGSPRMSLIVRDVSERRQAEDELRRAKAQADTASQAKSEFLSRMSHELRTPLNAMLGFAQLLELEVLGDQLVQVSHIRRAGRHLLNLINEVLDISRIEAGELSLSPEPVLVEELIGEAVALIAPVAAAHDVTLAIDPGSQRLHVQADRQRIRQVMLNLLSNGVKYNRPGGSVAVRFSEDDGFVRIAVQDTGIGISAPDLARLFTPFLRLRGASAIEGTGVGLALSYRLAEAMGGRILVESSDGRGSTFTVVLPRAEGTAVEAEGEAPAAATAANGTREGQSAARARVLCVEDNPANVRLLEAILARRPEWELVHAAQGQLGVDLATADRPDLVLLDLHLPDMPGTRVLQRLKACATTEDVPVVVVSADATPGQLERLRAAGADGYLTKPIDVAELLGLLDATMADL